MSGRDTSLRRISRHRHTAASVNLTVFESIILWQIQQVGILHAQEIINLLHQLP